MKLISEIALLLITGIVFGVGQSSCTVDQFVNNLPIADVNGAYWTIYDFRTDPENRAVVESDPSCMTFPASGALFWMAELGYWSPVPAVGDSLIMIGSWDSAYVNNPGTYGDNPNHTGFYWLYSDIVDDVALTHWEEDTVRPIPKPIITQTGLGAGADDTIWVKIPNPKETRRGDQLVYDVLGYWLVADSTGAGTPNALNDDVKVLEIGFIPVQGDTGDTTVFWMLESDMFLAWTHWTTYFSYKIVARPDTVGAPEETMGYSTYYWSQNSDAIDVYQTIIGIEDTNIPTFETGVLDVFPNPSKGQFTVQYNASVRGSGKLELYDVMGRNLGTLWQGTMTQGLNSVSIQYGASGVYFLVFECGNVQKVRKIILE